MKKTNSRHNMAKNSATTFDKDISMEIQQDEELLWRGKPQKASFLLSKNIASLPFVLFWLGIDVFGIVMILRADMSKAMYIIVPFFFALHLMPVWLWIRKIVVANKNYKSIEYAFTNQKIIIKEDETIKSYYYHTLRKVNVKVGLVSRLFKVGDITISGNRYVYLLDIDNPYAISQKLQQFIDTAKQNLQNEMQDQEGVEYEEYFENAKDLPTSYQNANQSNVSRRFTSKQMPSNVQKNEEDEYLDNIMNTINKKDEL